ncbi:hypothetical protein ABM34_05935 [Companilactobacillus ginsenosidimutans]|uniref:Uncharacterized protein n=1 Tax=Companilactobacillus ginsenosidimutans TaxID=1007676 RepID=A0A0H4QJ99_9LACO|nr:hypothetical protein ABM34_05935 [Companilactobacillus ginsenosidimutans]
MPIPGENRFFGLERSWDIWSLFKVRKVFKLPLILIREDHSAKYNLATEAESIFSLHLGCV